MARACRGLYWPHGRVSEVLTLVARMERSAMRVTFPDYGAFAPPSGLRARSQSPGQNAIHLASVSGRKIMNNASRARLVLIGAALVASTSLRAAEVTYERLQHPEPQNWLMNHHDYSSQR